jgi:hypothetical protein
LDVSGDSKVISALAKLAYEFEAGLFRPYAAAGLGIAEYEILSFSVALSYWSLEVLS